MEIEHEFLLCVPWQLILHVSGGCLVGLDKVARRWLHRGVGVPISPYGIGIGVNGIGKLGAPSVLGDNSRNGF